MRRQKLGTILLFIVGTLALLPNFYRNKGRVVDQAYYTDWQTRYDRIVVARLVKTRADGFFSAGGLMGIGDETKWIVDSRTNRNQFNTFFNNGKFRSYLVYKANPGFQGFLYGLVDEVLTIPGEEKLKLFRAFTALASAIVFGLIVSAFASEFGLLSGALTLFFAIICMWIVLPAGSIFWDFWAFYMPFLAAVFLLADSSRRNEYKSSKIHVILFITVLIKILFSGFDLTSTVLVMATVPFVYQGIRGQWDRRIFVTRMLKLGLVLAAAAATGLLILSIQIYANDSTIASAYIYILQRIGHHAEGSAEYFFNPNVEVGQFTTAQVVTKYLVMPAIHLQLGIVTLEILYWQLILVFAFFTLLFLLKPRTRGNTHRRKALALIAATWYSISAPLSWYLLFQPHSFIHTHVNTMGWQMPFTLLGFALCGFVITDFFTSRQETAINGRFSPSSQTDSPLQSDTYTPRLHA